jgi:hypothetical protein
MVRTIRFTQTDIEILCREKARNAISGATERVEGAGWIPKYAEKVVIHLIDGEHVATVTFEDKPGEVDNG